jgi:DeoR family ulaG and ulaABCDEF operon transcriptional repressor
MFMGTPAIGAHGVMESDPLLIQAEQKLLRQAEQLVVLADSSKIGARAELQFCALDQVDVLITDSGINAEQRALFEGAGIEVIVVEVPAAS